MGDAEIPPDDPDEPVRHIVRNVGDEPSVVLNKIAEGKNAYGYNAAKGNYGDTIEFGIIDPSKEAAGGPPMGGGGGMGEMGDF